MSINRCSPIEVREVLKTCLQLSGCQAPSIEDFNFILQFVIENYNNYKLSELKAAFKLFATNKLNVEKHIIFNPKLIGEVMSAYTTIALQVRSKMEQKINNEPIVPKLNEEQTIKDEVEWWEKSKNKDWRLLNYQVFDILWKRKKIKLTQEQVDSIKNKVIGFYKSKINNDKDKELLHDDSFIKQNCKKYTLALYLNKQL